MATTASIRFQGVSGLPEDVFINTLHFWGTEATTNPATIAARIEELYNDVPTGGTADIANYLSDTIDRAEPVQIRLYDVVVGDPLGAPYAVETFTLDAADASDPLPEEVALVSSFSSNTVGELTTPNQRGRNYVGPLNRSALSTEVPSRPLSAFIDNVRRAYAGLAAHTIDVEDPGPNDWVTLSVEYSGTPPNRVVASTLFSSVKHGWVDNAWDTQRRRGVDPTGRSTWSHA